MVEVPSENGRSVDMTWGEMNRRSMNPKQRDPGKTRGAEKSGHLGGESSCGAIPRKQREGEESKKRQRVRSSMFGPRPRERNKVSGNIC